MGKKAKKESINPFADLSPAAGGPGGAPEPPPPMGGPPMPPMGGPPPMMDAPPPGKGGPPPGVGGGGGKAGWRRVSTRQWIRDFRDHIQKYQTFPYKAICGFCFWSFGYYPDMIPQESYQRYIAKYPPSARKLSMNSGQDVQVEPSGMSSMASTTSMDSKGPAPTDSNANLPMPAAAPAAAEEPPAKGKKGKKGKEGDAAGGDDAASAAGGEGKKKKGKKGAKEGEAAGGDDAASATGGEGKKKKGKKGAEKAPSEVSGNIAFDPAVYDLTTITVMNIPTGADEKKLKKLFPGGKVALDGAGGAVVTFPSADAAKPFFTKDVALDGQSLVISPKLKA